MLFIITCSQTRVCGYNLIISWIFIKTSRNFHLDQFIIIINRASQRIFNQFFESTLKYWEKNELNCPSVRSSCVLFDKLSISRTCKCELKICLAYKYSMLMEYIWWMISCGVSWIIYESGSTWNSWFECLYL